MPDASPADKTSARSSTFPRTEATGITRGALYHFASKEAVFDAVLDDLVAEIAIKAGAAARATEDPMTALREGFRSWLRTALDPTVQRIVLLDSPSVLGWARLREIDEQWTIAGIKATLEQLADQAPGSLRLPTLAR